MGLLDGILGAAGKYGAGVLNTVGSVGGALIGANAATQASKAQQRSTQKGMDALTSSYNQGQGYQQPAYDTGMRNLSTLDQMVNAGQFKTDPYGYQVQDPNFQFKTDPGYQFRMQQGQNQINSGAAAAGNQLSGASQKALAQYNQGFASNEYNNAFNRYNNQYQFGVNANQQNEMNRFNTAYQSNQQQYGMMNDLANMGINAGNNMSQYANNYGQNMAGQWGNMGNAQASGIMGRAQAWQTGLNNTMGGLAGNMNGSGYTGYNSQFQPSNDTRQQNQNNPLSGLGSLAFMAGLA